MLGGRAGTLGGIVGADCTEAIATAQVQVTSLV